MHLDLGRRSLNQQARRIQQGKATYNSRQVSDGKL